MRGKRTTLVESILVGSFRPDRHGSRLLSEPLPEECPLEDVSPGGVRTWRDLVTAQRAYMDARLPNPWAFARLVRLFHAEGRQDTTVDSMERFRVDSALRIGPYPACPDELLARHWQEWAHLEEWEETHYAFWRFGKEGLSEGKASAKVKKVRDERREKWMVARLAEMGIRDVRDPFLMGRSLEDRVRLIRAAGLE